MADFFTVEIDRTALFAALDRLGPSAVRFTKPQAKITADLIADSARSRVARRTGVTAAGIDVREDYTGDGYIVASDREPLRALPAWLEFGTKFMTARPYLFNAALLEMGPHERRIAQAIQDAIDAEGFGGG